MIIVFFQIKSALECDNLILMHRISVNPCRKGVEHYLASARISGVQSKQWIRRHSGVSSSGSPRPEDIYDVVCVGGGPAGLSLLAGLSEFT